MLFFRKRHILGVFLRRTDEAFSGYFLGRVAVTNDRIASVPFKASFHSVRNSKRSEDFKYSAPVTHQ